MKKGFTMIELIFVIVILGILASVAIPRLSATRADAEISSAVANLRTILSDVQAYYVTKGDITESSKVVAWSAFTNVALKKKDGTSALSDTARTSAYLFAGGVPCIQVTVIGSGDGGAKSTEPARITVMYDAAGASNSVCKAVQDAKAVTSIKDLSENNTIAYKDERGTPATTTGIILGSITSVY